MKDIFLVLSGVLGWLVAKDFLLPQIEKLIDLIRKKKKNDIDTESDLSSLKEKNNDIYENQIEFLMQQVKSLENQLLEYQKQLDTFRSKILELNSHLTAKALIISQLKQFCCSNTECKCRVVCSENICNFDEKIKKS
ncbi:MAG: hypothetical protein ACI30M_02625 [Muribaculaceae bacterium]